MEIPALRVAVAIAGGHVRTKVLSSASPRARCVNKSKWSYLTE